MKSKTKIQSIQSNLKSIICIGYIILIVVVLLFAFLSSYLQIPVRLFTQDLAAILDVHPLIGFLSNIGILFWSATVAICIYTAIFIRSIPHHKAYSFLLYSGLFSLLLLLDDFFMLHEHILPNHFYIPQKGVYIGYFLIMGGYFYYFRKSIFKHKYQYLILACLLFGISITCDIFLPNKGIQYLIEDGFKLLGIFSWFVFYTSVSYSYLKQTHAQ